MAHAPLPFLSHSLSFELSLKPCLFSLLDLLLLLQRWTCYSLCLLLLNELPIPLLDFQLDLRRLVPLLLEVFLVFLFSLLVILQLFLGSLEQFLIELAELAVESIG